MQPSCCSDDITQGGGGGGANTPKEQSQEGVDRLSVSVCADKRAQGTSVRKTRARQTAELLMRLLQTGGKICQQDGLAPNDPPKELLRSIETRQTDLLVVSHMPFVARAVAAAVTGEPDRPMVHFQPGSVAGLERDDSRTWRITLLIGPGLLDSVI